MRSGFFSEPSMSHFCRPSTTYRRNSCASSCRPNRNYSGCRRTFLNSVGRPLAKPEGSTALCCCVLCHSLSISQKTHHLFLSELHCLLCVFSWRSRTNAGACSKHCSVALRKQVLPMLLSPLPTRVIVVVAVAKLITSCQSRSPTTHTIKEFGEGCAFAPPAAVKIRNTTSEDFSSSGNLFLMNQEIESAANRKV